MRKSPKSASSCGQYRLAHIRFWHGSEHRSTTDHSCPLFALIRFADGWFRTSFKVEELPEIRVIPRKSLFDVAMQNAQDVFESLQEHSALSV